MEKKKHYTHEMFRADLARIELGLSTRGRVVVPVAASDTETGQEAVVGKLEPGTALSERGVSQSPSCRAAGLVKKASGRY